MATINLNFADVVESNNGPLDDGPCECIITEVTYYPAGFKTTAKGTPSKPNIEVVVRPNVAPGSPLETKKLRSWIYLNPESLWKAKQFFEAVYRAPFEEDTAIDTDQLIGLAVVAVLETEEREWTDKKTGSKKSGIFNNIASWEPSLPF